MRTILILIAMILAACAKPDADKCSAVPAQDLTKPGVLVIGDSISMGYTPFLSADLADVAQVTHPPCNCMSSSNGVRNIDLWLSYRERWRVVTLNHGLWDIPPNEQASSLEKFEANLREEIGKAQLKADSVVLVNITYPAADFPAFTRDKVDERNAIIAALASELGLPLVDLNWLSDQMPGEYDDSRLHFTPAGYSALSKKLELTVRPLL